MQTHQFVLFDLESYHYKLLLSYYERELEHPILASGIHFRFDNGDPFTRGCLLFTWEAISIFKLTVLCDLEFVQKFTLLNVSRLQVDRKRLFFLGKDSNLTIACEREIEIARRVQWVLREITFKLPNPPILTIESTIPLYQIELSRRPEFALRWRVLFLALYYGIRGGELEALDYFDEWERSRSKILTVGVRFNPGNAGAVFGHAIGWESSVDAVCFENFYSAGCGQLMNGLMANALTMQTVMWCDYEMGEFSPFEPETIKKSSVNSFLFVRSPIELVHAWLEAAKHWPQVCSVQLNNVVATGAGFTKFTDMLIAPDNAAVHGNLRKFEYIDMSLTELDISDFRRIVTQLPQLDEVVITESNGDAEFFLRALLGSCSKVRMVTISKMMFLSTPDPASYQISPSLVYLSLSGCTFTPETLNGLLRVIASSDLGRPIVLDLQNLHNAPEVFTAFNDFPVAEAKSNILECDLSGNTFSRAILGPLFSFLSTQTRLRLLRLEGVQVDSPSDLLRYARDLVTTLPLPGLDIGGNFDASAFADFLRSLSGAARLQRLSVRGSGAGIPGIDALASLLTSLPQIAELSADGFAPRGEEWENQWVLSRLWTTIAACKSLVAVDRPSEDAKIAGITQYGPHHDFLDAIRALRRKPRPSTTRQRVELLLKPVKPDDEVGVFTHAAKEILADKQGECPPTPKRNGVIVKP
jgi:hypothetical protein